MAMALQATPRSRQSLRLRAQPPASGRQQPCCREQQDARAKVASARNVVAGCRTMRASGAFVLLATASAAAAAAASVATDAFAPPPLAAPRRIPDAVPSSARRRRGLVAVASSSARDVDDRAVDVDGWTSLTDDGGAKMRLVSSSSSSSSPSADHPVAGKDDVTVEYVGTVAERNWSAEDAVACWLPDRGLSSLAPELFRAFDLNERKLTSPKFDRKFVVEGLGVRKEGKIDNLLEAAKELGETKKTHRPGTVFDKNRFTFRLGKGMAVEAFELALPKMRPGDTASLVARSDYAYGRNGAKAGGKVLVPPYATVSFDLTLVEIK
ncbi:hypothetical protein ACHAWF_007472 [Thalassiosira exigua]